MTSSKIPDGGTTSKSAELPELHRPPNDQGMDDDDEGFQTVVSKRTVKLMQLQQQQQSRQHHRRGYHNGYGHHYGNGNGRHYHRQYGPPSNSSGNSNSSASSIPEELPKDKETGQDSAGNESKTESITLSPTVIAPPVMAWARIAAGEKPPKLDQVPPSPAGSTTDTCSSPVDTALDMKPLAISLVVAGNSGNKDIPMKPTEQASVKDQADKEDSPTTATASTVVTIIPPPPPSVWKMRAAAHNATAGQAKPDVAQMDKQTGPAASASAVVAGNGIKGKASTSPPEVWPSLEDAIKPIQQKVSEVNTVSFTSQTEGTTPSESATDSGNEEILRITGPPQLSDEKWPLPLLSTAIGKEAHAMISADKLRQSRHTSGDAMSSSGCDLGASAETGDGEEDGSSENRKKKKNKKASKPNWVPLILEDDPPKPPSKPKKKKERFEQRGSGVSHHNGATGGDASSECGTPTDGLPRTNRPSTASRLGGNGGGRNGHKGNKQRQGFFKFYKETSDPSQVPEVNGEGYDYTQEFTTVNPLFPPLTEFVMPYTTYATYSPPPDAQAYSYAPIPIDEGVLTQLIQKQIEYYFSEENLDRDFYLRRKMNSEGYIPISLISSFYRIQSMTQDYAMVLNAIKASELIEVKDEEEGCAWARPVESPTKWPIVDTAAASIPPPPTIIKSFLPATTTTATTAN